MSKPRTDNRRLVWSFAVTTPWLSGLIVVLISGWCATSQGIDFVVESSVKQVGSTETRQENTTIFDGQLAFDYHIGPPPAVTVFDFERECLWRLDADRKQKQYLPFQALARLTKEATLRSVRLSPLLQFAADPEFTSRTWNPETRELVLHHDLLQYRAVLRSNVDPQLVSRYREFADWSARLNTLNPGLPPSARMELNQELAMRGAIPQTIVCRYERKPESPVVFESTHRFRQEATPADTVRLTELATWLKDFHEIEWKPQFVDAMARQDR
jgi:hypothetical protein